MRSKIFVFAVAFIVTNLLFFNRTVAAKRVTAVTYGAQSGAATFGTGTSVTYTITLTEAGASAPVADNFLLTWASGAAPTGVTYTLTSTTETPVTNTSFTPSGTSGRILTLTITTTGSTPAGSYGLTLKITDNNGAPGGPYSSTGLSLVVGAPANSISYTGSPFTYYVATTIPTLTPVVTGAIPVAYAGVLPAGLTLDPVSGQISGTPTTTSAAAPYTITATYSSGAPTTATINIKVLPQTISYTGSPYTYYAGTTISALTPTVTNTPASYGISPALPTGLNFDTTTGIISGMPTVTSPAAAYTITATYTALISAATTISITVLPQSISYTGSPFTFYQGSAIPSLTPTVTNSPTNYSISPSLPAGLSISATTGVISGSPTTITAAADYTVTATYGAGIIATTLVNIQVGVPTISYTGSPFTYATAIAIASLTPSVTGSPTGYTVSPSLPAGLSINAATGVISGTPTVVTATAIYTITAAYTGGITASTSISVTVNINPPVITYNPATVIDTINTAAASLTPINTGGATSNYSISPALPAGLAFDTSTGIISGTPTAITITKTYTIKATNAGGNGTTTITLAVVPHPPLIRYVPAINLFNVNTAISSLTPKNAGGNSTSFAIDMALPAGLTFDTTTGTISGTPTAISGVITYTVTATNAGGSQSTTLTISVAPPVPVISYAPATNIFTVGTAYTLTPTNTGGADTTFDIGPSLPPGLSFDYSTGIISGTPTAVSPVTTYVISGDNNGGTSTTTITLSCVLPDLPAISYTPSTNVYGINTPITPLTPANTGGTVVSYSISTALPTGLSFSKTTGVISGTSVVVSAATIYTIIATNAAGNDTTTVTLTVKPLAPVLSYTPSTNVYTVGTAITSLTPANTGGAVSSYSINTPLPAGLSFSTTTGVISGTPTVISSSTTYTITATNATGSSNANVTITINHNAPSITYSPGTVTYPVGTTIIPATPINTGGAPTSYSISTTLPAGLSFNTSTGIISGAPTVVFPTTTYTVTATNTAGSSSTNIIITVSPEAPVISYTPSTNVYTFGTTIPTLAPTNTGGAVVGYTYATTGTALTGASLAGPSLMTIDASGNIYVANYNGANTISRWNSSHTYLGTYTTGKSFSSPEGIVFDSAGNSYVEDTGSGEIYKFNSSGAYVSTIITGLSHPLGISIDASDNLYIATYVYSSPYTSSVTKYSTSGTLLQTLSNAQMNESDGVAVDQSSGIIYVLNRGNNLSGSNQGYVTYYNSAGTYLGTFSTGYNDPLAISVDPSGNIFVADSHNDQVKIYSNTGVLLNTLNGFTDVEGFTADASGNLYVSDFTNNTVKEYLSLGGYHISAPLPPGLSFSTTTGQISGTPKGTFPPTTYTITAYNITGNGTTKVTLSCVDGYDWIGVTSTDWNTPSNWVSGVVPPSSGLANIGVNIAFNYFPNVTTADGTVNVGSIGFGNLGSQAPGVVVNNGATLNVLGAMTYQSDASATVGYTCTLSGAGTLNADSALVIANSALGSPYTATMASSVNSLNISGNIGLTSYSTISSIYNATFNLTGGTTTLNGVLETSNTSTSTSTFAIVPATTATLNLVYSTALSGLASTGTNIVTFNNPGATVNYSGGAQTVYSSAGIAGLPNGVSYQSIIFSGTGVAISSSGTVNIAGDFTNATANSATNYVQLANTLFNGTTQNLAGGAGTGTKFFGLGFSGAGTKTMVSGTFTLAAQSTLTMIGNSPLTILNTGGLLTLLSHDVTSASVAAIPQGPSIVGTVYVQRYITGGTGYRGYRLASSPVYAATVNTNNVYSINYLQNSMYLTGNAGGGFDKTGNPTLYLFREDLIPSNTTFISGNFWGISAINNSPNYNYYMNGGTTAYNIPVGNGYYFFFRGNRASASLDAETTPNYDTPVAVTLTAAGTLNQGQVVFSDWYTPTSANLGYTGTGTGSNFAVRGFNLVGNPYASSIDWESFNTTSPTAGVYGSNVGTTVYELDDATNNYDLYQKGGAYTNRGKRTIVSGQGFFVVANNANAQLIFNETAKTKSQLSGLSLFMARREDLAALNLSNATPPHIRLQLAKDSVNTDDTYIGFDAQASSKYVPDEDAPYKSGTGLVSLRSFSTDSIMMGINKMPFARSTQTVIPLFASAKTYGTFTLKMTEIQAIPQIYEVWLMDKFNKDSLDIKHNPTYTFDVTTDTNSYGGNRFQLVIRQDPALAVHLLSFAGQKVQNESQVTWITENEQNYTNFTVERSTNGAAWSILGGVPSAGQGTYNYIDKNPQNGADSYRLQITDLNGVITYSNVVTIVYGNAGNLAKTGINVYPNPAKSTLNLNIDAGFNTSSPTISIVNKAPGTSYDVQITNILGSVIRKATISETNWQTDVSSLTPGTYVIQVVNKTTAGVMGQETFIKL